MTIVAKWQMPYAANIYEDQDPEEYRGLSTHIHGVDVSPEPLRFQISSVARALKGQTQMTKHPH